MPVKVMQTSGSANYSDIAAGINYAVTKGARVINLSLGGYANSKTLQDAVDNALAQNIVVVAGSGNDSSANPFYPAAYPGVISVAATDSSDHKANFSNYGSWVKVSAPGVDVLTTGAGWGLPVEQRHLAGGAICRRAGGAAGNAASRLDPGDGAGTVDQHGGWDRWVEPGL